VLSHSPVDDQLTQDYEDAWITTQYLIYNKGGSLSGREWNRSYLNLGLTRFAEVTNITALDSTGDGRGLATTDWDDDGRLDIFLRSRTGPRLQFFRNQNAAAAHFLSVELRGVDCSRDAIGARVSVELDSRTLTKTVRAGEGFLSQSSRRLHFGLGDAERVRRLTVRWPGGTSDVYEDLEGDRRYTIEQGAERPVLRPARTARELAQTEPVKLVGDRTRNDRIVLIEKLPLQEIPIPAFGAPERKVADVAGSPVLINLWGSTCAGCLKEFSEFQEHAQELEESKLRIVTLTTDAPADHATAKQLLERFGLRTDAGYANQRFMDALQVLLVSIVGEDGGYGVWPLPLSLLLDARGQLVAIYPARVEVETLLEDVATLDRMRTEDLSDNRLQFGLRLTGHRRNLKVLARGFRKIQQDELAEFYTQLDASR
jgi:peroxiredoxin